MDVSINGTLTVTGNTSLSLGGLGQPLPHSCQVTAHQDLSATGAGEPFALNASFSYGFTFTATTDLGGFVCPTFWSNYAALNPPVGCITGVRSNFLASPPPIDEIVLVQSATATALGTSAPTLHSVTSAGAIQLTYVYTPAPAPIPEPSTLILLGSGVVIAGLRRRMDRRGRP